MTDHILNNESLHSGPLAGPNGLIIYSPPYIQPPSIRATCHLHKKPLGFKTLEDLETHVLKEHRVWKG